jgi:hypothetical protein
MRHAMQQSLRVTVQPAPSALWMVQAGSADRAA